MRDINGRESEMSEQCILWDSDQNGFEVLRISDEMLLRYNVN